MAHLSNNEVVRHFVDQIAEHGALSKRATGGTLVAMPASLTGDSDQLIYRRRGGTRTVAWGPVVLCRYLADRKIFLVNGDGFTDNSATGWQTQLRGRLRRLTEGLGARQHPGLRVLLVPFAAMEGAEIQMETVRPIEIRADTWDVIWHSVPNPPPFSPDNVQGWSLVNEESRSRTFERVKGGVRFRAQLLHQYYENIWRHTGGFMVRGNAVDEGNPRWIPIALFNQTRATLHQVDQFGRDTAMFRQLRDHPVVLGEDGQQLSHTVINLSWGWVEERHHLGASIFSAVGEDGKRHKFISAFDEGETNPLYFLAQLPDRSGVTTYSEAIEVLAPPIVKKAREDGKLVIRQGDVFAIEVDLTDEQVYANARSKVRRSLALFDLTPLMRQGRSYEIPNPEDGEISEMIDCPCGCGHRRRVGFGPKARNALSIYGTGHTADQVVVAKQGMTYIKGTIYHNPSIHEAGRQPEHRPIQLGDGSKWFLAVRNTVPRRRRRIPQEEPTT